MECGNRLRVGVRAKTLACRGLRVGPSKFGTYRAIIVRYPTKTRTKEFGDSITTSIARYEKYRCWASKFCILGYVCVCVCARALFQCENDCETKCPDLICNHFREHKKLYIYATFPKAHDIVRHVRFSWHDCVESS